MDSGEIMLFFVYVLFSPTYKRKYVGMTMNLENHIEEYNRGQTKSTKTYRPWILVYVEEIEGRQKAREREKYLKSGVGREFINEILKNNKS